MEVKLKVQSKGQAQEGISAIIIDGPKSWAEIAASSNEFGEISLPVEGQGEYTVKLFTENGEKQIKVEAGKLKTIEI